MSSQQLKRVDILGAVLLLGISVLVVTALQQGADGKSFRAPSVLALILMSGIFIVAFLLWQWFVTTKRQNPQPILPWRIITNRICVGMIL